MITRPWFVPVLVGAALAGACQAGPSSEEIAAEIQQRVIVEPAAHGVENPSVQALYGEDLAPLWIADDRSAARAALEVIRTAADHGLDPDEYFAPDIARALDAFDAKTPEDPLQLAELDLLISRALLALGRDVAFGRIDPAAVNPQWISRREPFDLVASLSQAVATGGVSGWLEHVRPRHPQYAALQAELRQLRQAPTDGSAAGGDDQQPSVGDRIEQIGINLERWRWQPDDFGATHILVNIPAYHLAVHEHGTTPLTMRVIVGDPDTRTPVFSSTMTTVVFSPYWNIPESIIEGEIAVVAARDPSYLRRNNIDILRVTSSGIEEINPSSVNWDDEQELKRLSFRQRPGAQNALGHVKFLFPNPYHVYLHDTPADRLFNRSDRALSHGCVRLEKPEDLAAWILRDQSEWDRASIRRAMDSGTEKHVALKTRVPVHTIYMTVWVDEGGTVRYSEDVYEYDEAQLKLSRKAAG